MAPAPVKLVKSSNDNNMCTSTKSSDGLSDNKIRLFVSNMRGYNSKVESLQNIVNKTCSDIVILTETHCMGRDFPKLANHVTFYRNRSIRRGGGVAVLLDKDWKHSVLVDEGDGENE